MEVRAMPGRRAVEMTELERARLEHMSRHDPRPYMREKAAAVLKVADGRSGRWVALYGLTHTRDPETIYAWLDEFEQYREIRPQPARRGGPSPQRGRRRRVDGASAAVGVRLGAEPMAAG